MGTYYYRARYYYPQRQRFLSEDPIEFRGRDVDLYAYVGNSPVTGRDPFGLWTAQIGFNISGTGASGGAVSGFFGFVVDHHGNIAKYAGGGYGVGLGAGGSLGVGVSASNARDVCGISGPFTNLSAGGGNGAGATSDFYTGEGDGPNGFVTGAGVTIGLAGGASGSAQRTYTFVYPISGRKPCSNK